MIWHECDNYYLRFPRVIEYFTIPGVVCHRYASLLAVLFVTAEAQQTTLDVVYVVVLHFIHCTAIDHHVRSTYR